MNMHVKVKLYEKLKLPKMYSMLCDHVRFLHKFGMETHNGILEDKLASQFSAAPISCL